VAQSAPVPDASATAVRLELLGPVRVWRDGVELGLGPPQQRALLAVLLAGAGQPVSLAELVELLWDGDPPVSAATVVHKYVGELRRLFEPDLPARAPGEWLLRQGGGYRLAVDAESFDLARFRELARQARHAVREGRHTAAVELFGQGLAAWRGRCAAGTEPSSAGRVLFTMIDQEHSSVAVEAADCALHAVDAGAVVAVLRRAASWDPLNESLQARLMLVLAAAGHQAEALTVYQRVRARLADDLGVDPGADLRSAHQQVLRQQSAAPPAEPTAPATPPAAEPDNRPPASPEHDAATPRADAGGLTPIVRPAQLPPDLRTFTGRHAELAALSALLPDPDPDAVGAPPGAVPIGVIDGIGGIGKTSLAVHWAHTAAGRFPDGQLYVNLHGFDPSGSTTPAAQALREFLDALGVPPQRVPDGVDAQAGLYRSVLAGRRIMVVLDNARDLTQVRPLLPGSPGCVVIVTSRHRLTGLAATHAAKLVTLRPFDADDSRSTLARTLGDDLVAANPDAVERIVALCAGLPLAVGVVAARTSTLPSPALAAVADELRDARTRLDALASGEAGTDVRAVFSWSYRLLSPPAARLFRLLPQAGGPDLSLAAAVAMAGQPLSAVRRWVAELTGTGLLTEHLPGRYLCHDLVAAYARELTTEEDDDRERYDARRRLLDYYLQSARTAHSRLEPMRPPPAAPLALPGVLPADIPDREHAMRWLATERQVLNDAVRHAGPEFGGHAWRLALCLPEFYQRSGYWHDWEAVMRAALAVAVDQGDLVAQAHLHHSLAGACFFLDREQEALRHLLRTSTLFVQLGMTAEHADVCTNLGAVHRKYRRWPEALSYYRHALELFRLTDNRRLEAKALDGIGRCQAGLGDHRQCIDTAERALTIFEEIGDPSGAAASWSALGTSHSALGDHAVAIDYLHRAIDRYRGSRDQPGEASALDELGDVHLAAGDRAAARAAWLQALAIYEELRLPMAATVRAKIDAGRQPSLTLAG
jgi:DNA-binding SARP family transcriptional activator/tetratricopeptide (TPR) repeat protein